MANESSNYVRGLRDGKMAMASQVSNAIDYLRSNGHPQAAAHLDALVDTRRGE